VKNSLAKKTFGRVSIVHGVVLLTAFFLPVLRGCAPKPKEVITFVDLAGAPAPASAPEPESDESPAPELKPESKPVPKPEPKPEKKTEKKLTPRPAVTNTPPKKVETNAPPKKVEPKKAAATNAPPKAKTLEERLKEVRQGGRPVTAPSAKTSTSKRPQLDFSGIKSALNSSSAGSGSASSFGTGSGTAASGTGSGSGGGMYSPFAGYYDSIKQRMYSVWQQPSGAPKGIPVTASIRVERDGTVSFKSISRRSGNAQLDQSVQNALNATTRLPPPPADLPDLNITVEFVLSD